MLANNIRDSSFSF